MQINYTSEPLVPTYQIEHVTEFTARNLSMSFWDFLNSDVRVQLDALAFKLLYSTGVIRMKRSQLKTVKYQTFETDSITETVYRHILAHIIYTGDEPMHVIVGYDIHKQLLQRELQYSMNFSYTRNSQHLTVRGIKIRLMPNMNGFVILDKWSLKS
jgi:hypothetical protein